MPLEPSSKPRLVSILIATHNEAKHIEECLASLTAQTYSPIEIIVVDDGSSDATRAIVKRLGSGVRLIELEHRGKAHALNHAAKSAQGEVLFFLDGDMTFDRRYVETMAEPIFRGKALGTAHEQEFVANHENRWSVALQKNSGLPSHVRLVISGEARREGSIVFRAIRREAFLDVNGFDELGFLDDQTLARKLRANALFVQDAVCRHYNVETLGEVYASGRWAGKSLAIVHGLRAIFRYNPVRTFFEGLRQGMLHRSLTMTGYWWVRELGLFVGILSYTFGGKNSGR